MRKPSSEAFKPVEITELPDRLALLPERNVQLYAPKLNEVLGSMKLNQR